MNGILDFLNSDAGRSIISGISNQTGEDQSKTSSLLTMAMPVLMQAMKRNASSQEGAQGLLGALDNSKHDGSILSNLGDLFAGGVNQEVKTDGDKILGHILGNKKESVTHALSSKAGLNSSSTSEILKIAAPILMGMLGKQKREQGVSSSSGIEGLLGGLLQGNSGGQEQSFLESILDANNDGSVIDDVAGMVLGGNKKKSGLGGLLGGLFGKK